MNISLPKALGTAPCALLWAGLCLLAMPLPTLASDPSVASPPYTFTTLVGKAAAGGTTGQARFRSPESIALDIAGNLYVVDTPKHTIHRITPAREVTTVAGQPGRAGSADGMGIEAQFSFPRSLAMDGAGNLYVADCGNNTIRHLSPQGRVTTLAGRAGQRGRADGTGCDACFSCPSGVAVDTNGNVYVADTFNHLVRKVTPAGVVTTLAGRAGKTGCVDGTGSDARFSYPSGVAVDTNGNVYVADTFNNLIRKVTPAGVVTTLAGQPGYRPGGADGTGKTAQFYDPRALAVDSAGNVYVADRGNCTIRRVTPTGVVTTLAGLAGCAESADGTGSAARFDRPLDVKVDSVGSLYVADAGNATIRKGVPAHPLLAPSSQSLDHKFSFTTR